MDGTGGATSPKEGVNIDQPLSSPKMTKEGLVDATINTVSKKSLLSKSGGATVDSSTVRTRAATNTPKNLTSSGGAERSPSLETVTTLSKEALKMSGGASSLRNSSITSSGKEDSPSVNRSKQKGIEPPSDLEDKCARAKVEMDNADKIVAHFTNMNSNLKTQIDKEPTEAGKKALQMALDKNNGALEKAMQTREQNSCIVHTLDALLHPHALTKPNGGHTKTQLTLTLTNGKQVTVDKFGNDKACVGRGGSSTSYVAQDPSKPGQYYCHVERTGVGFSGKSEKDTQEEQKKFQKNRDELRELVGGIAPREIGKTGFYYDASKKEMVSTHADELLLPVDNMEEYFKEHKGLEIEQKCAFCDQFLQKQQFMADKQLIHRDIKPQNILYRFAESPEAKKAGYREPVFIDWDGARTKDNFMKMNQSNFQEYFEKADVTGYYATPVYQNAMDKIKAEVNSEKKLSKSELTTLKEQAYELERQRDLYNSATTAYLILTGEEDAPSVKGAVNLADPEKMSKELDKRPEIAQKDPQLFLFMKKEFNKATAEMTSYQDGLVNKNLGGESEEYRAAVSLLGVENFKQFMGICKDPVGLLNTYYENDAKPLSGEETNTPRFETTNPKTANFIKSQLMQKVVQMKNQGVTLDATKYPEVTQRNPELFV